MNCKNCGNPLNDDAKFCIACGQSVEAAETEEVVAEQEAEQATEGEESAVSAAEENAVSDESQEAFAEPDFEETKKPKKGKKKIIIAAVAGILAIAVALSVVFNLDYLKGFYVKTFGSDAEYYSYVEKRALSDVKDSVVSLYGSYKTVSENEGQSLKGSVKVNIGGEFLTSMLGASDELDFLKDISIDFVSNNKEGMSQVKYALTMADTCIISYEMITDMFAGKGYMAIPEFSDSYLMTQININEMLYDEAFIESLPEEDTVNELLDKYIDVLLNNIADITSSEETVKVNGVSQDCTVLSYTLNEKSFLNIVAELLKSAKTDSEIKAIINDIKQYGVDNGLCDSDYDLYGEFTEFVDDTLEEIKDEKNQSSDGFSISLSTYVNSDHEIIGRKITTSDKECPLYYVTVEDGDNTATTMQIGEEFEISGKGKKDGDAITGNYILTVEDEEICTFTLTDFDASGIEDGVMSGSIKIAPNMSLLGDAFGDTTSSMLGLYNPALEIVLDTNEDSQKFEINLLMQNMVVIGLEYNSEITDAVDIKIPDKTIDVTDADAIGEWLADFDPEKILANLEKAGLPTEFIEGFAEGFSGAMQFGYDDYGDYYSDDIIDFGDEEIIIEEEYYDEDPDFVEYEWIEEIEY